MTQAEKDAEAQPKADDLVDAVMKEMACGGWGRDLATRIIALVREHDARTNPKEATDG